MEIDKVTLSTVTEQHHFNFAIKRAEKNALFFIKKKWGVINNKKKVEESTFKLK